MRMAANIVEDYSSLVTKSLKDMVGVGERQIS